MTPKVKTVYRCTECGAEHPKWAGRCDVCGEWNTLVEEIAAPKARAATGGGSARRVGGTESLGAGGTVAATTRLRQVVGSEAQRVRTVQEGTFMRQGGVTAMFTPRIDVATGRVDIAVTRTGDQAGASGSGLIGALLFDAIGPGNSLIQVSGVASTPEGTALALQFAPASVTVR